MALIPELVEMAVRHGAGDKDKISASLTEAARTQSSLLRTLLDSTEIDENGFYRELVERFHLAWGGAGIAQAAPELRSKLPARIALRYQLLPVAAGEDQITLLTYDPFDLMARQAVAEAVPQRVRYEVYTRKGILPALRQVYGIGAETFEELLEGRTSDEDFEHLRGEEVNVLDENESEEASVKKFINQVIREALRERATDIHVEPLSDDLRVRYRIDGVLQEVPVPSQMRKLQRSVINILKLTAGLDLGEDRRPQDGRISLELGGQPIDVRVASIPTINGESISLRLLGKEVFSLERLGLDQEYVAKVRELLALPNGIILVTGPTGCGKSTTLYTFLSGLNTKERRILTIEDPVEHKLPGINQSAVQAEIGNTFANLLRSFLRGDPNVIMVGEMRDYETAEIAIRAALTGHLVFSTLHTNDAVGGITRLLDMDVEPFLVASAVRAFIAQRLVRRLCSACKTPAKPGEYATAYLRSIGFPMESEGSIMRAVGCENCRQSGYEGRLAIMEICMVTPKLQEMITQRKTAADLRPAAEKEGMRPLRKYGFDKVVAGVTTIEEVIRVTSADVSALDE
ncbi:MAG: type II/IV secretion system protein [Chthoniobacterales bacterium]|jgi:general secretion pathway protein E/type IV pilus assembly protein PilB|nr:type II/IV secretion system protein [Chthoniobacterales bacterium]